MTTSTTPRLVPALFLTALLALVWAVPDANAKTPDKDKEHRAQNATKAPDDWTFEADYAKAHPAASSDGAIGGGGRKTKAGGPTSFGLGAPPPMPAPMAPPPPGAMASPARLGLSAGGAKDIANFRENLAKNFLPLPTDVSYEGVFYDYYFDIDAKSPCDQLFCPTYTQAVSKDPFSGKPEYYLSVNLASNIAPGDFKRKKLNLMLVLDISGSMSSPFDAYYYDRFGKQAPAATPSKSDEAVKKSKLDAAKEAMIALLDHLTPEDRFGLVLFDDQAYTALTLKPLSGRDMETIKQHIRKLDPRNSTNLDAGLTRGTELMARAKDADPNEFENRIIFLTDAMPNLGSTSDQAFLERITANAKNRIHTTVIGIGVDFNTELTTKITKARGANSYSVHSPSEFKKRLDEEFDYMVTPLVFNLSLDVRAKGYAIDKVFGSPEADAATGQLMRVNTLFPSPTTDEKTRGGLILLRLTKTGPLDGPGEITLSTSYEDRAGKTFGARQSVVFKAAGPQDAYDTPSVRKGVLLLRYVSLLRRFLESARQPAAEPSLAQLKKTGLGDEPSGPVQLGEWERASRPLAVSPAMRETFAAFRDYFKREMAACDDKELSREVEVLERLSK